MVFVFCFAGIPAALERAVGEARGGPVALDEIVAELEEFEIVMGTVPREHVRDLKESEREQEACIPAGENESCTTYEN